MGHHAGRDSYSAVEPSRSLTNGAVLTNGGIVPNTGIVAGIIDVALPDGSLIQGTITLTSTNF